MHSCTIDSLKGSDDWSFKLDVTFPYKWITSRIVDIRNFANNTASQRGIINSVCNILDNVSQDIDDSYELEKIDKEQFTKEAFKEELKETFSKSVRLSGLPLEIITNELFTIKILYSQEYLTAVQKFKTAEKEALGRRALTLAEQQTVLQMKIDAGEAGAHLPLEYFQDIYLRQNNQSSTKYKFEGLDPTRINPTLPLN
ncbi:MAG: hypothetical protein IPI46_12290 [Bacteroidetes bacterium]|nr:hypothetical protein [Bacteroidota bacterium]